jgi:hypothetical protein
MNSKTFSETFSKGVRTVMHLKWASYLLLFENMIILARKQGMNRPIPTLASKPKQLELCGLEIFHR